MKLGDYHFVPTFWPSLLFLVLMPFFVSLGVWQLNRAEEKLNILAGLEKQGSAASKSVGSINVTTDKNTRVRLSGKVLSNRQFLLDNKVYNSVAGYELIAAVKLKGDERIILVSRGWVAQGRSRSELPNVELPPSLLLEASGLFTQPSKGYTIGEALNIDNKNWPKVIQYLDYQQIGKVLGGHVIEGVVQLDKALGKQYPKLWKPIAFGPEKHFGYAAQWFAIAVVLLLLYIVLNTKKEESY